MIRAVIDANILVSGIPASDGPLAAPIDQWRAGRSSIVVSEHILDEVARAWAKPYWQARFSPSRVTRALALLREAADVMPITVQVSGVAAHPEDDLVLATALSGRVNYLVTGDKAFQELGSHEDVTVLSPRAFLDLLEHQDAGE